MQKAPNWNLNTNLQKKMKLGMLANGNKGIITFISPAQFEHNFLGKIHDVRPALWSYSYIEDVKY